MTDTKKVKNVEKLNVLKDEKTDEYNSKVVTLLKERNLPTSPWHLKELNKFVEMLASMDSNNFPSKMGMGEREARIFSAIVENRYYCFGHGIGRSGDISAVQPKAAGASVLNRLLNDLILNWLQQCGAHSYKISLVIPLNRSMALMLCLLHLKKVMQFHGNAIIFVEDKFVQIAMMNAGIEGILCSVDKLEALMSTVDGRTACLISTTNDTTSWKSIVEVGLICRKYDIPHIIDNAAGLYNRNVIKDIQKVIYNKGRIDVVLSSTDTSFLVPTGGCVLAGVDRYLICKICASYPGRASMDATINVFLSLMRLGSDGYNRLIDTLLENIALARESLKVAVSKRPDAKVVLYRNYTIAIQNAFDEREVRHLMRNDKRISVYQDLSVPLIALPLGVERSDVLKTVNRICRFVSRKDAENSTKDQKDDDEM